MLSKRSELPLVNFAPVLAIIGLVLVGWMASGYCRLGFGVSKDAAKMSVAAPRSEIQATPVSNPSGPGSRPSTVLSRREAMVYIVSGDDVFFHTPVHVMHEAQRQAVAVSVARSRGLVPCPVCFKAPVR